MSDKTGVVLPRCGGFVVKKIRSNARELTFLCVTVGEKKLNWIKEIIIP
jgi:hypothetical protein